MKKSIILFEPKLGSHLPCGKTAREGKNCLSEVNAYFSYALTCDKQQNKNKKVLSV